MTTSSGDGARDVPPDLLAFPLGNGPWPRIAPAARWRKWMNDTHARWANRCLPLLVANEHGWVLLNSYPFVATWTGEDHQTSLKIEFSGEEVPPQPRPESHFGYGIVTWTIPYLFQTPPGYNLLVRGPANWPKDGAHALEGLVETDWSLATFTMNWKITRPNHPVSFDEDEPYCMIVPQRRGELRSFRPRIRQLAQAPDIREAVDRHAESRHQLSVGKFLAEHSLEFEPHTLAWEQDYFRGRRLDGTLAAEHEKHLRLPDFEEDS
jgi:hypothetical protein